MLTLPCTHSDTYIVEWPHSPWKWREAPWWPHSCPRLRLCDVFSFVVMCWVVLCCVVLCCVVSLVLCYPVASSCIVQSFLVSGYWCLMCVSCLVSLVLFLVCLVLFRVSCLSCISYRVSPVSCLLSWVLSCLISCLVLSCLTSRIVLFCLISCLVLSYISSLGLSCLFQSKACCVTFWCEPCTLGQEKVRVWMEVRFGVEDGEG